MVIELRVMVAFCCRFEAAVRIIFFVFCGSSGGGGGRRGTLYQVEKQKSLGVPNRVTTMLGLRAPVSSTRVNGSGVVSEPNTILRKNETRGYYNSSMHEYRKIIPVSTIKVNAPSPNVREGNTTLTTMKVNMKYV